MMRRIIFNGVLFLLAVVQIASLVGVCVYTKSFLYARVFEYATPVAVFAVVGLALAAIPLRLCRVVTGPSISVVSLIPLSLSFTATLVFTQLSVSLNPTDVHTVVGVLAVVVSVAVMFFHDRHLFWRGRALMWSGRLAMLALVGVAVSVVAFAAVQDGINTAGATTAVFAVGSMCNFWVLTQSLAREVDCLVTWPFAVQLPYAVLSTVCVSLLLDGSVALEMSLYSSNMRRYLFPAVLVAVCHVTTSVLLSHMSFFTVTLLTVPAFVYTAITAHGEKLSSVAQLWGAALVCAVLTLVAIMWRAANMDGLTEQMRKARDN